MVDRSGRLVAASPTGLVEAPDEVDVLPEPERLVEAADVVDGLGAHDDHRTGHVGDACARSDPGRVGAQVERRSVVAGDPGCDQPDPRIVEVGQERRPPRLGGGGLI